MVLCLEDKLAFLARASTYRPLVTEVEVIETHLSWVFMAGEAVYKLKKPVLRPSVYFGSLATRKIHCESEISLNQRLAPGVYRGAVPEPMLDAIGRPMAWFYGTAPSSISKLTSFSSRLR